MNTPLEFTYRSESETAERARDFAQIMKQRRSVREFSSDPVPDDIIRDFIRAAASAPSGANKQPWFFAVVKDPSIKARIREAAEEQERLNYESRYSDEMLRDIANLPVNPSKPYLEEAPVLIVVFKQSYRVDEEGFRRKNYYVNESIGIAAGILVAAIHQAGLATLTHTPSPMRFLNEILQRPHYESAILLMPVGYPKNGVNVPDITRKSFDEICREYR
ncbi:MAG: nitroreductase family protein [Balneolales bacterium]|nr:nitroreductase family protein [Balneolales bacterium]